MSVPPHSHEDTSRAIIGAAREMDIQVIAEGVETKDQRELLLSMAKGAKGQGFYFSEPVEVGKATELPKQGTIDPNRTNKEAADPLETSPGGPA